MAINKLRLGTAAVDSLYVGGNKINRAYLGSDMVWDQPFFVDDPKIDPAHNLANRATMKRLVNGDLTGITVVSGAAVVVDNAYASSTAGTLAFARTAFPATNLRTFRVSGLLKVDKTAGRYSSVGFSNGPLTTAPGGAIGHIAGQGISFVSLNSGLGAGGGNLISEAACVDGAWYRVSIIFDNITSTGAADDNTGKARVWASAEPVDPANTPANPWYPNTGGARYDTVGAGGYIPSTLIARTNSPLGTIRDLYYIDSALGATSNGTDPVDNAPIVMGGRMGAGTSASDLYYLWSKGKTAPLRVIITAGGSGTYGGMDFGHGFGRTGHPYDAFRKTWRDLADLGYTVLHTDALDEGWGADDHLTKQLEALNTLKSEFGVDVRLYYLGYSMGGVSAWRAIRGRAGFPSIRAAYIVAGIAQLDMYYDIALYSAIKTRWPIRANLDEPHLWPAQDLIDRGTRVRQITSTGDTSVLKTQHHDLMKAKYASAPELYSEIIHAGINHFDPAYWNAQDVVDFFEGADL